MTTTTTPSREIPRLLVTPLEAATALGVSRTRVFALLASGAIESVRVGRSRRITVSALEDFVAALRDESDPPRR